MLSKKKTTKIKKLYSKESFTILKNLIGIINLFLQHHSVARKKFRTLTCHTEVLLHYTTLECLVLYYLTVYYRSHKDQRTTIPWFSGSSGIVRVRSTLHSRTHRPLWPAVMLVILQHYTITQLS